MEKQRYDINVTPSCPACAEHVDAESWRLLDSFAAVKIADPNVNLRELRIASFQAYHARGSYEAPTGDDPLCRRNLAPGRDAREG